MARQFRRRSGACSGGTLALHNAVKLDAADALGRLADETGWTLPQLATAFVARHPAVSTVVIGHRTIEQLENSLAADGVERSTDILDRIDAIVPPGASVNIADTMWTVVTRDLDPANRRR